MCGIVGVVGKPARDIILNGLTNLEYRGYDSAGIYLNDLNGNEYLTKQKLPIFMRACLLKTSRRKRKSFCID